MSLQWELGAACSNMSVSIVSLPLSLNLVLLMNPRPAGGSLWALGARTQVLTPEGVSWVCRRDQGLEDASTTCCLWGSLLVRPNSKAMAKEETWLYQELLNMPKSPSGLTLGWSVPRALCDTLRWCTPWCGRTAQMKTHQILPLRPLR